MIKIFVILTIFVNFIFASDLLIHSKVFTHILNYDKELDKKLVDNHVKFVIVYNNSLENDANNLKELILNKYKSIKEYPLDIELIEQSSIKTKLKKASAIYIFDLDDEQFDYVVTFAIINHLITFANKPQMLERGVAIALSADRRVKPIINKRIIKQSNIKLSSTLLKVSKIYE